MILKKTSIYYQNNAFYGKTMEKVRNRLKIEFVKKDGYREILKQQSKLNFNGIPRSYENCDSYTFKQNEILIDKPVYLGFSVLELSKTLMYETYYDKLQPILVTKFYTYIIWILIAS